jgi:hypothetical protein
VSAMFVVTLPAPDAAAIHRNRNFAEELEARLRRLGHGHVIDPDDVRDEIRIAASPREGVR